MLNQLLIYFCLDNGCKFFPCPEPSPLSTSITSSFEQAAAATPVAKGEQVESTDESSGQPTSRPTNDKSNVVSMAESLHQKFNPVCTNELFMCGDGHYVGRDPDHNCDFFPCTAPATKKPTQSPIKTLSALHPAAAC